MSKQQAYRKTERGAISDTAVLLLCSLVIAGAILLAGFIERDEMGDNPAAGSSADSSKAAPDFKLKDLSGKEVRLSDYKGKIVAVNFWATWCAPCVMEIPSLVKLRQKYSDRGLEIIGISLDGEEADRVAGFARELKIDYPIVMGTPETVEAYGPIDAIPTTFIIDAEGKLRSRHLGMLSFEEMENAVKSLL